MSVVQPPPQAGDERASLLGFLDLQRGIVRWKLDGVAEAAVRSASTPNRA